MFTEKNLMAYIHYYISECNRIGVQFKKVILFGSYARNTPHEWSDIDLALVSDDFTGARWEDRDKTPPADIKFIDIEPHLFNTAYFEESDPFIEEIKRTGKEIILNTY